MFYPFKMSILNRPLGDFFTDDPSDADSFGIFGRCSIWQTGRHVSVVVKADKFGRSGGSLSDLRVNLGPGGCLCFS